jgi:ribA/ribD-fused uncharacterized protein
VFPLLYGYSVPVAHDRASGWWGVTNIESFTGEYDFLSNFYSVEVMLDGIVYPSVEHAYQAAKTNDPDFRAAIRRASSANKAKLLGRRVELVPYWDTRKILVMYGLLVHKFSGELGDKLLATGDAELIEGNHWHDNIWGNCNCSYCDTIQSENWLGRLLMVVREELKR